MSKLHKHNLELYNQVQKYIHNQTESNAIALVEWCQREGGKITGFYPTNYVSQDDLNVATMDKDNNNTPRELSHEEMKKLAEKIRESDIEYGTYWETIKDFYFNVIKN